MSIDNNTAKTSFFKKIGNWWNKNGNTVGKGMQIAGATAMGVGMTGMFIDAMNKPTSIFGGCYLPYGMMGMSGCCSPYSMMNMGGSLFGYGGCPTSMAANIGYQYGTMIAMQENMMNMQMKQNGVTQYPSLATNPYIPNYINMNPYMQNLSTTNPYFLNSFTNNSNLTDTNNEVETDTWDNTKINFEGTKLEDGEGSKTDGSEFDLNTDKLGLKEIEEIQISKNNTDEEVKTGLKKSGQNLVAKLDTSGDGYVDIDEYMANEKSKTNYNATIVKRAFSKIDLNNDNKLDWTELASVNGTFTMDKNDKKITNIIKQDNYNVWSVALGDAGNSTVVKLMGKVRAWLMGSADS